MTVASKMANRSVSVVKKFVNFFKKKDKNKHIEEEKEDIVKDGKGGNTNSKDIKNDKNKDVKDGKVKAKIVKKDSKQQSKVDQKDVKDHKTEIKDGKQTTIQMDQIIDNLDKFVLSKKKENSQNKELKEDRRSERIDSQSSGDSGFVERDGVPGETEREDGCLEEGKKELDNGLVEILNQLKIAVEETQVKEQPEEEEKSPEEDGKSPEEEEKSSEEKEKKLRRVVLRRAPTRNKTHVRTAPYEANVEQISQVNRRSFSGGFLTVTTKSPDEVPNQVVEDYWELIGESSDWLWDENINNQPLPIVYENFNYVLPSQEQNHQQISFQEQNFQTQLNEEQLFDNLRTDFTQNNQFNNSTTTPYNDFADNNTHLGSNICYLQNNTGLLSNNTQTLQKSAATDILADFIPITSTAEMGLPIAEEILPNGSFDNTVDRNQNATVITSFVEDVDNLLNNVGENEIMELLTADQIHAVNEMLTPDLIETLMSDDEETVQSKQYKSNQVSTRIAQEQFKEYPPSLNTPSCSNYNERSMFTSNMSAESLATNQTQQLSKQNTSFANYLNHSVTANNNKNDSSNHTDVPNTEQLNLSNLSNMDDVTYLTPSPITQNNNLKPDDVPYLTPPSSNRSPLFFNSPNYSSSEFTSPLFYSPCYSKSPEYVTSPQSNLLSPGRNQKFQDIPSIDSQKDSNYEIVTNCSGGNEIKEKKMGMVDYKRLQRQLSKDFQDRDCCKKDSERTSCNDLFREISSRLLMKDRYNFGISISRLNLDEVYEAIQEQIEAFSSTLKPEEEDKRHHIFAMLCQRLFDDPSASIVKKGLGLLQHAAVRCPHRPLLTRYIVRCIRNAPAVKKIKHKPGDVVFDQIGENGDNLVTFCAREPDKYGDVLAELLRKNDNEAPLFDINHRNADGYSALHIACRELRPDCPSALYAVHVLLKHGQADIYQGDSKGGDTAIHFAVNSPTCDFNLVLLLFTAVDDKKRKHLATLPNMSSITPLQYARTAASSTSRKNYPKDVYNFLTKCR